MRFVDSFWEKCYLTLCVLYMHTYLYPDVFLTYGIVMKCLLSSVFSISSDSKYFFRIWSSINLSKKKFFIESSLTFFQSLFCRSSETRLLFLLYRFLTKYLFNDCCTHELKFMSTLVLVGFL